jgi:LysR family transcriptional regulator for metE and metH
MIGIDDFSPPPCTAFMDTSIATPRVKLEVRDLQLMEAVGDLGSITRAAGRLNLTQSALSHQLKRLEARLDAHLFERIGGRLRPTRSGLRLIEGSRELLVAVRELQDAVASGPAGMRPQLRVSASCSTYYSWLTATLGKFASVHRDVDVEVEHHHRDSELAALRRGALDLIVGAHPPIGAQFESAALFATDVVAVLAPRHRLVDRVNSPGGLRWKDLAGERLLIHDLPVADELALRQAMVGQGARHSASTTIQRVVLTEAIFELARAGHGVGLIGKWIGRPPMDLRQVVVAAPRPAHRRQLWATWIKTNTRGLPLHQLALWIGQSQA